VNKVFLTGRLTRDPEMRSLASGKNVTTFTIASNEFLGGGREKAEYSRKGTVYQARRNYSGRR
jgi:single-stranded DNA-binding protein